MRSVLSVTDLLPQGRVWMYVTHSRCPGIFVDTFGKATRSTTVFAFFHLAFVYLYLYGTGSGRPLISGKHILNRQPLSTERRA